MILTFDWGYARMKLVLAMGLLIHYFFAFIRKLHLHSTVILSDIIAIPLQHPITA